MSKTSPRARREARPGAYQSRIVGHGQVDPRELAANPANWREHGPEQREAMREVLQTIGWVQGVIVNRTTGRLIDGHMRVEEAIRKGEATIPVCFVDLTEAEERRLIALFDPISGMAGLDRERLQELLADLRGESGGLEALLRSLRDAAGMDPERARDEDEPPPLPETPVSRPGDLWRLGRHRVYCGDATDPRSYARLLGGARADVLWTDPPYGVGYVGKTREALTIENDRLGDDALYDLVHSTLSRCVEVLRLGGVGYVSHADSKGHIFRRAFLDAGFKLASVLIWRKNCLVLSRLDYMCRHEPILYGWTPGRAHQWYGGRKRTSVLEFEEPPFLYVSEGEAQIALGEKTLAIRGRELTVEGVHGTVFFEDKPAASREHPTMKPVALIERMLANSTKPDQIVLDPFAGSGSTLIAADARGCSCRAMDIDPRYVDVIIRRWQKYSGGVATLDGSGAPFALVAQERRPEVGGGTP